MNEMERIQLLTAKGDHVAYVEIIHFPPHAKPQIVMWGSRVFARGPSDSYVEAFAVASLTPSPGLDHGVPHLERLETPPVDRTAQVTTDGRPVAEVRAEQQADGNKMHASYIVLSDEERARGFVRPVRARYRHVGIAGPKHQLRELTAEETTRYAGEGYVKFEIYPESESPATGRLWTQKDLDAVGKGCKSTTTMGTRIAETYARDPSFYGSTMCVSCGAHYPVGADGEFVWDDGTRVGT